jgi:uncharacterized repeat protein (TIGR03803 family)
MKSELTPPTANDISAFMHSAKKTRKQWCAWAPALAIMVALGAVPPSAQGQTFTTLYSFKGGTDGANPNARVIRDTAGNLYGTTVSAGDPTCLCGTVFKLDSTGKETVLHSFTRTDGANPYAGVIRDAAGNLYGTAYIGGDLTCNSGIGCGTVFKLDTTGKETVLHSFTRTDGANPYAGVIRDAAGNLYGTAYIGGDLTCNSGFGCGTVFKLDTTGKETVLHRFTGKSGDGANPYAGVIRDAAGNLYGTTAYGGGLICDNGCGTVFKLDSTGKETVLYRFTGGADGSYPVSGVTLDAEGNLYGTTAFGGVFYGGVLFRISNVTEMERPIGSFRVLHSFGSGSDGKTPVGGVSICSDGNLYGTTSEGGDLTCGTGSGCGTVFKLDTTGKETVLYSFTGGADGSSPAAGLVRDAAGNLYGTAYFGGDFSGSLCSDVGGCGVVFKIAP